MFKWIVAASIASAAPSSLLYQHNAHIVEPITPLELKKLVDRVHSRPHKNDNACSGSLWMNIYSASCPHCINFVRVWNEVARAMECPTNDGILSFGAFEAYGQSQERQTGFEEWQQVTGTKWENQASQAIYPHDLVWPIKKGGFPQLVLFTKPTCHLSAPFEEFNRTDDVFIEDIRIYHVKVESDDPAYYLKAARANLFKVCPDRSRSHVEKIIGWLSAQPSRLLPNELTRWSSGAREFDPDARLYDAIMGFYLMMGNWVFASTPKLDLNGLAALKNMLLLSAAGLPYPEEQAKIVSLITMIQKKGATLKQDEWIDALKNTSLLGVPYPEIDRVVEASKGGCTTATCLVWTWMHTTAEFMFAKPQKVHSYTFPFQKYSRGTILPDPNVHPIEVAPEHVPQILSAFIREFFDCTTCRAHFTKAIEQCAADSCRWTSSSLAVPTLFPFLGGQVIPTPQLGLVLWLWRFHNIVNVRTAVDEIIRDLKIQAAAASSRSVNDVPASDISGPSDQFTMKFLNEDVRLPSVDMCPQCRVNGIPPLLMTPMLIREYLEVDEDETKMVYDKIDDFNLVEVTEILERFYIKAAWVEPEAKIAWNERKGKFDLLSKETIDQSKN